VRVDHGKVEWCDVKVHVGQSDEHGVVDEGITLVDRSIGLVGVTSVVASQCERRIGSVQLVNPHNPSGGASSGAGDVGVVRTDSGAGCLPVEEDLLASEGKRLGLVARDGGATTVASDVKVLAGLVGGDGGQ